MIKSRCHAWTVLLPGLLLSSACSQSNTNGADSSTQGAASSSGSGGAGGSAGGGSIDAIIPPGRRIDWTTAGVPGGIPARTTICATIDASSFGNGAMDASGAITLAIKNCPPDQVVLLTAGNFSIQNRIEFHYKSNVTLRGAGPDKTVLFPAGGAIMVGDDAFGPLAATVVGGATKGSTTLTLSSTANLAVGGLLRIDRLNTPAGPTDPTDADLVHDTLGPQYVAKDPSRRIAQMIVITGITGDAVTVSPPLIWDFSASPSLTTFFGVVTMSGVEDLKIDHSKGGTGPSIIFDQAYGCWAKNISSYKPGGYHLQSILSVSGEIRDSYFNDSKTYGPDNAGVGFFGANTGWAIENNVFFKTFPSIELQLGSSGNYIGYNYSYEVMTGAGISGVAFDDNHGAHDMMNLWEGNSGEMFQVDGYWGSGSHGTLFRNNFTAENPSTTLNYKAVSLNRWAYYYNIVGNVLGTPSWPATGQYEIEQDGYSDSIAAVYQLGYPNMGNTSYTPFDGKSPTGLDAKVKSTLIRYKNYDYFHKAVQTDSAGLPDQPLPASLRYKSKPAFWPLGASWPPIGPDVKGYVSQIPAEARYMAGIP